MISLNQRLTHVDTEVGDDLSPVWGPNLVASGHVTLEFVVWCHIKWVEISSMPIFEVWLVI